MIAEGLRVGSKNLVSENRIEILTYICHEFP